MSSSSLSLTSGPTVEIQLSRSNRAIRPSDIVEGKIVVKSASLVSHYGVRLAFNGSVNMCVDDRPESLSSLVSAVKPITIVNRIIEVRSPGRIPRGTTEMPFSFSLRQTGENTYERYYETFHGTNINIQYLLTADVARGYLQQSLAGVVEFIVERDKAESLDRPESPETVVFYLTQDTQRHPLLPELKSGGFRVSGKMSTSCSLSDPITGHMAVDASIADGDVCRGLTLPIYVILTRLLIVQQS